MQEIHSLVDKVVMLKQIQAWTKAAPHMEIRIIREQIYIEGVHDKEDILIQAQPLRIQTIVEQHIYIEEVRRKEDISIQALIKAEPPAGQIRIQILVDQIYTVETHKPTEESL